LNEDITVTLLIRKQAIQRKEMLPQATAQPATLTSKLFPHPTAKLEERNNYSLQ